jgi:hypothetical protein
MGASNLRQPDKHSQPDFAPAKKVDHQAPHLGRVTLFAEVQGMGNHSPGTLAVDGYQRYQP